MISIIDYGMGNLRSVEKALQYIGIPCLITSDNDKILKSDGIILPGVGAFPDAIDNIRRMGIDKVLHKCAEDKKPILGICLGMQLLFDESEEVRKCSGLGLLKGSIVKMTGNIRIPHMGWNSLEFKNPSPILKNVPENSYVYFVHSYYAVAKEDGIVNAVCEYGREVPAVVSKGNVIGLQFHPEKSGDVGIIMLKNFGGMLK